MRPEFLGTGAVIIPLKLLHYTVQRIETYMAERTKLLKDLIKVWDEAKADAKQRNPDLYKESEYPSEAELKQRFSVSYNIFSVAFPDIVERLEAETVKGVGEKVEREANALRRENTLILTKQREEQEKQLTEAVDELKMGLRKGLLELTHNLEDKVRGVGNERKVFKPGFVSALRTYLETFDAKNLSNDKELAEQVARCRAVLSGVSPELIRSNIDVKVKLEQELGSINSVLSDMLQPRERNADFS